MNIFSLSLVSAFYAECENKRVCFNSHIWTKSKFLGLSIGVHMAGSGECSVIFVIFSSGIPRFILTYLIPLLCMNFGQIVFVIVYLVTACAERKENST